MRSALAILLTLAAGVLAAPAPFIKSPARTPAFSPEEEMKRMLGKWHRVSCTYGQLPPVPKPLNDSVVFSMNKITYNDGSGAVWDLKLGVEGGKKTWDISQPGSGAKWLGLYEMDGDNLRVCFTSNPTRPPTLIPSRAGDHLQTFKRKLP